MCTAILVAAALLVVIGALTVLRSSGPHPNAELLADVLDEMLIHYADEHREKRTGTARTHAARPAHRPS